MDILSPLFFQLSQQFGFNLLDLIILAVVFFYVYEGYTVGFVLASLDLASFVLAFIGALKFYGIVATGLIVVFSMPTGLANAIGFFITAFFCEIVLSILFRRLAHHLPSLPPAGKLYKGFKKVDRFLGMFPGALSAFIILSFLLTVIVSLPSSPIIKNLATGSYIGGKLIANTSLFEKRLNDIFGGALNETINFLTVEPKSNEVVDLHFKVTNGMPDVEAEREMFLLVNKERTKHNLTPLMFDNTLRDLARAHSQDMFARGYFSHYTPDGFSPFDRMTKASIAFTSGGENLALSPSTELAMIGLINSPGHLANILSPNFGKIGIGVIDGGSYGKMYSQEFTD